MLQHYAMIPMEEYQEFMLWKRNQRSREYIPEVRRTPVDLGDDVPF